MADPMSREEYAAALAELDLTIHSVDVGLPEAFYGDADKITFAITNLTEATLAVAKGIRLLAEPTPVEYAEVARDPQIGPAR